MPNPLNSPVQKYALQNLDIITNKHNEGNKLKSCGDFRQKVNWNPLLVTIIFLLIFYFQAMASGFSKLPDHSTPPCHNNGVLRNEVYIWPSGNFISSS